MAAWLTRGPAHDAKAGKQSQRRCDFAARPAQDDANRPLALGHTLPDPIGLAILHQPAAALWRHLMHAKGHPRQRRQRPTFKRGEARHVRLALHWVDDARSVPAPTMAPQEGHLKKGTSAGLLPYKPGVQDVQPCTRARRASLHKRKRRPLWGAPGHVEKVRLLRVVRPEQHRKAHHHSQT